MALIFLGKTTCAICGKVLLEEDAVMGLPPLADTGHPLYKYFDCGFHVQCFENWDRKGEVLQLVQREKQQVSSAKE